MRRTRWARGLASLLLVVPLAVAAAAPAASAPTPDQLFVADLEEAADASRAAFRNLTRPSEARTARAEAELRRATEVIASAARVAPRAVGALETPSVRRALQRASALGRQAVSELKDGRYARARSTIQAALELKTDALRDFGVPLAKEFGSFAVNRDFSKIPGFAGYSGLTATAETEVTDIVIGAADRTTANAGEEDQLPRSSESSLPITDMSVYIIRDPIGRFTSNWCRLDSGLITCRLRPTLQPGYSYTIAFGPKLERGTELLIKFRTDDGRRSYAVFATR